MPRQVVSVPAVERWRDIHRAVDKSGIQGNRKGQIAQRNVAERERQRERIEGAGSHPGKHQRGEKQRVAVYEGKKGAS